MRQKDRSDWMAFVLILVVFAALLSALMTLGTGSQLPFIGGR